MAGGKLTARSAATTKPGTHGDGAGLYLVVSPSGGRKWVYRFTWQGKIRMMGLGSADVVSLAEARGLRDEARRLLASGSNPIEARREQERAEAGKPTFGAMADAFIDNKGAEWRNAKHRAQWTMTLREYCGAIRSRPVDEIDTEAVLSVLQPLWLEKPETASRLRGRIEAVLDAARARGHIPRNEANPARWRGHLDKLLPKRQKLTRGHHAAMPYAEVPGFVASLRERDALAAMALEFCILTATRTGEVLGARWSEIDMAGKVWTVPAERTKPGRPHRIPLAGRAMSILEKLAEGKTAEFVFPGQRAGKPLSNMAMEMVLRRMKIEGVTVHGFRSAFRDWAGNETRFPREVAEAALSHVIGDKAEQAYRRGDALEKRRALMDAWASYCEPPASNVIKMRKSGGGSAV
ncbi:site-specific integrase [Methylocystis sp. ATCC 49242]|uniref:tyrosine-type recombinase/integrase n=1 Tax=Methylocystis sp. ATCC 49242 TaxID=622637 RepID=UPI0001F885CB|nr:site-specific integrase [Methylocystis sp. ATCC 49242]